MKILVTGANGQLGSEIKQLAASRGGDEFTFVDVAEMDLGSDEAITVFFSTRSFDFVINCAAYTAVDKAEEDQATSYRINSLAVKAIATVCKEKGIRLIHISTDYVFDGAGNMPIHEEVKPNPLSVYGKSKLEGEQHALRILPDCYVIRTAWVYSSFGKNFVKTISKLAKERESLSVVYDQVGSPTYAGDLAQFLVSLIDKVVVEKIDKPGIYHYSNEGAISWYDFAVFIVKYCEVNCAVIPIPSSGYKTLATRPVFSVLDKAKTKEVFGIRIPHWYESLVTCLNQLKLQ